MRVLIACEESGRVREAFRKLKVDAWSCDIIPSAIPGKHIQCDVRKILSDKWDMMIAFPPCTYLTVTANRVFLNNPIRWKKRLAAMNFVYELMNANIEKICIENPIGVISTHIRKPDQIVHPYFFGDPYQKSTCLWLKNLPLLKYKVTDNVDKGEFYTSPKGKKMPKWLADSSSTNRPEMAKLRSRTFMGIANAMATQWSNL